MFGFVLCWLCVALACDVIVIDVDWVLVLFEIGAVVIDNGVVKLVLVRAVYGAGWCWLCLFFL